MAEHFRGAEHLPNKSGDEWSDSAERLPRQQRGTTPQMYGRYPDFDVLAEAEHWDELTRRVILERVETVPPIRFFTPEEARALRRFCDIVMAQHREPRIPVLEMVDRKLYDGKLDGFRYADMPDDRETWRRVATGLDEAAAGSGAKDFADAPPDAARDIGEAFSKGELEGGVWDSLPCAKAWSVVMRAVLSEFYSHPWAWNEIGFGGPAYPRGYARLGVGLSEGWEGEEALHLDPVPDVKEKGLE